MRARSAVFDLYGDHLGAVGSWAPIASVVTLLQTCGIQPAATRTAVSRMSAQGWLRAERQRGVRGYLATEAARQRLTAAHHRIFRRGPQTWDGRWRMVVVDRVPVRADRDRVAATLGYLGYGRLAAQTWVAAHRNPELAPALDGLRVGWEAFEADHLGDSRELAARAWDLTELARRYQRFTEEHADLVGRARSGMDPDRAYPLRAELVHQWRNFLFLDPELPEEVMPAGWPGTRARELFLEASGLLLPPARRFVAETLAAAGAAPTGASDDPSH